MYYLKCNNCGHLNKLDNENLLFCGKCNKKLENNFRDWQRKNSESSFEDFKKMLYRPIHHLFSISLASIL